MISVKVREVLNCELVIVVLLQLLSWTDVARMCLSMSESLTPSPPSSVPTQICPPSPGKYVSGYRFTIADHCDEILLKVSRHKLPGYLEAADIGTCN